MGEASTEKDGSGELKSWPVGHPVELEARLVEHLCSIRRDVS